MLRERALQDVGCPRSLHASGGVSQGTGHRRVHGWPGKSVTEDRVAQGLCMTQEGHCRVWGMAGPVDAPGGTSHGVGHHVCSKKGVVEGVCVSESLPATLEGDNWAGCPRARMPRGPSASREDPSGVCPSWEAMAQIPVVVCPSDDCGGFAIPTGLVGLLA